MTKNKVNTDSNGYLHAYVSAEDLKEDYPYIYGYYNTIEEVLIDMGIYEKVVEKAVQSWTKMADDFLESESPDSNLIPGWLTEQYNHQYGKDTSAKRLFKSLNKEEKKLFLYGAAYANVYNTLKCEINYASDSLCILQNIWQKDEFVEGWENNGKFNEWHYFAFKFPAKYQE